MARSLSETIAEGRRLIEAATPGPVETSLHEKLTTVGDTNHWTVKEHEFPQPPYEGQLTEEWGVYPPLGEAGPVALVSGPHNAALFVLAVNAFPALLDVAEAAAAYQEEMAALGNGVDPALSAALSALGLVTDGEGKEKSNG